jgi:penicillin-binding protein 2
MAKWLRRFGFGERTGIDLSFEASGLIGGPEWSRQVRGTPWYPGEAVSVSIGQGPVLATTIQLARAFAYLANRGEPVTPHLVAAPSGTPPFERIDPDHLALINNALADVVHGPSGTARRFARLPMAGKTGTAQVARLQEGVDADDLAPELRHHAWFVGWAPLDEPSLVVSVIVEHGGGGGSTAAPVAAQVIEAHLGQPVSPPDAQSTPPPIRTPDSPQGGG